jgi:transcriptional regulator with XRE-family HTH domain
MGVVIRRRGWRWQRLADACEVTRSTLHRWLRSPVSWVHLDKIAGALDMQPGALRAELVDEIARMTAAGLPCVPVRVKEEVAL